MLIKTITTNAEEALLFAIESKKQGSIVKSFLQCTFSDIEITPPDADRLLLLLKDLLRDRHGVLYYCNDADIFIEWVGAAKGIKTAIEGEIAKYCLQEHPDWSPEDFFHYYDMTAHAEELRIICKHKIAQLPPEKCDVSDDMPRDINISAAPPLNFTSEQSTEFDKAVKTRAGRYIPEVLIVEDQAFSRSLLLSVLMHKYKCHTAKNAAEALSVFADAAPDIILLDIELPDGNGHDIAKLIRQIDPNVWIIMVTANHYQNDVIRAKENNVQGFIIKPYNKLKILEIMDSYEKTRTQ